MQEKVDPDKLYLIKHSELEMIGNTMRAMLIEKLVDPHPLSQMVFGVFEREATEGADETD